MNHINRTRQGGFTLVEIAIVLVIIGLLLVGVLQGQEMIENGKVKNLGNNMKGVVAAYYAYQDRYGAVPGDDNAAATRFTGAVNGGGNGVIAGVYTATAAPAAAAESNNFWQHTRMAGLLSGVATATQANPPTHTYGGLLGVQGATTLGMVGPVVCAGSVPWRVAMSLDQMFDDGDGNTGKIRATAAAATANAAAGGTVPGTAAYGSAITATTTLESQVVTSCMKI